MADAKKPTRAKRRTLRGVVVDSAIADEAAKRRERMERVMDAVTAFVPLISAYREYATTLGLIDDATTAKLDADLAAVRERYPFAFDATSGK